MLTRVYIDNFRCFEKFEYRPARKQLILGGNGSGKSTLMDALFRLRSFAVRGDQINDVFGMSQRTRWLNQSLQNFEIAAALDGQSYVYRLGIEPWGRPARSMVQSEILECNGTPIFEFKLGEIHYHEDSGRDVAYMFDTTRSGLATISPDGSTRSLLRFRNWLMGLRCFVINPFAIGARAESEDLLPNADLSNIACWYRHLVQVHPGENAALLSDLREVLEDFNFLSLEPAGENVRLLSAEFRQNGQPTKFRFDELSHGQRCLICLYAILHFVVAKGGTVIIDEPENFISLREIQPWLMAADDMADDHKGQVILISHHPELINQWAPSHGVQFVRDGVGPVRVERFRGDPESPLSASELVARGWERE
jgi:predicted ATPase